MNKLTERILLALLHLSSLAAVVTAVDIGSYTLAVIAITVAFFCGTRF